MGLVSRGAALRISEPSRCRYGQRMCRRPSAGALGDVVELGTRSLYGLLQLYGDLDLRGMRSDHDRSRHVAMPNHEPEALLVAGSLIVGAADASGLRAVCFVILCELVCEEMIMYFDVLRVVVHLADPFTE